MPKPLHLFIRPPYLPTDTPPTSWTMIHGYGLDPSTTPEKLVFNRDLLLQTTGTGELLAVASGRLSVRPPGGGLLPLDEEIAPVADSELPSPPTTLTLYLHLSPAVTGKAAFRNQMSIIPGGLLGFAYLNVETASLENSLAELLDSMIFPPGGLTRSQLVKQLLLGNLDVQVTAGHVIGVASTQGAPTGSRRVSFTALTQLGPMDPSHVYDLMRDFVEDGQSSVDAFLRLAPKRWPVLDPSIGAAEAIQSTSTTLYSMPLLEELRTSRQLSASEWRTVGDNQKSLFRQRLLRRVGRAPASSTAPPFEFDDIDWANIFQLESIVEFYVNFDDPWAASAVPLNPGDPGYYPVNFLDLEGTAAMVVGNVVTLDGNPDLGRVWVNQDTLFLQGDTARSTRLYRIVSVDTVARTVTLDAKPTLSGPSAWTLRQRPNLVLIDSFGARLNGQAATVSTSDPHVLVLDGAPDLRRVNRHFDTIYLSSDSARASRAYRITAVDHSAHTVTLDEEPVLDGGSSAWRLPGGLSGELPGLSYSLLTMSGHDHYDGMMFVVQGGRVHGKARFSSYTSRNYPAGDGQLSSVRGNRRYHFRSYRSNGAFKNYCFKVTDPRTLTTPGAPMAPGEPAPYDGVREGRYYFATMVNEDRVNPPQTTPQDPGAGKTEIRIHHGNMNSNWSGSAGCVVSPLFLDLRRMVIERFQSDAPLGPDAEVQKAADAVTMPQSQQLHAGTLSGGLTGTRWDDKIMGTLWVIRPDERPLG
jgi:hypothetical protein